jgi:type III pantothenate kinase
MPGGGPTLVLDLGNTALKFAVAGGGEPGPVGVIPADMAAEVLRHLPPPAPRRVLLASSNPVRLPELRQALLRAGMAVREVELSRDGPGIAGYEPPASLGPDRWLAARAAFELTGGGTFVVAAGTALTFDWIDGGGTFRGGAIAPGFAALAQGLALAAPHLPRPAPPPDYPGQSSEASVGLGLDAAFAGCLIELHRRAVRAAEAALPVVITGGDAARAALALEAAAPRIIPHLVLRALATLASREEG